MSLILNPFKREKSMLKDFRLGFRQFEVGYGLTFFRLDWVINE